MSRCARVRRGGEQLLRMLRNILECTRGVCPRTGRAQRIVVWNASYYFVVASAGLPGTRYPPFTLSSMDMGGNPTAMEAVIRQQLHCLHLGFRLAPDCAERHAQRGNLARDKPCTDLAPFGAILCQRTPVGVRGARRGFRLAVGLPTKHGPQHMPFSQAERCSPSPWTRTSLARRRRWSGSRPSSSAHGTQVNLCPVELKRHLVLSSDRYDTYPETMWNKCVIKSGPMEIDQTTYAADETYEDECEEVQAVGQAKGKSKGKGRATGKDDKGTGKSSGKGKSMQEAAGDFPYKCHNCCEKRLKARKRARHNFHKFNAWARRAGVCRREVIWLRLRPW